MQSCVKVVIDTFSTSFEIHMDSPAEVLSGTFCKEEQLMQRADLMSGSTSRISSRVSVQILLLWWRVVDLLDGASGSLGLVLLFGGVEEPMDPGGCS